jgi:hypothetical protein
MSTNSWIGEEMANPLEHTLDKTGRLDDETIRVVESVLCDTHPPINPAVLLLAMRNWYLVHGSGPVLRAFLDWLSQIMNFDRAGDHTPYREGQALFTEKTGIDLTERLAAR